MIFYLFCFRKGGPVDPCLKAQVFPYSFPKWLKKTLSFLVKPLVSFVPLWQTYCLSTETNKNKTFFLRKKQTLICLRYIFVADLNSDMYVINLKDQFLELFFFHYICCCYFVSYATVSSYFTGMQMAYSFITVQQAGHTIELLSGCERLDTRPFPLAKNQGVIFDSDRNSSMIRVIHPNPNYVLHKWDEMIKWYFISKMSKVIFALTS